MRSIRPEAVAGAFYPGQPRVLSAAILSFLDAFGRAGGAEPIPKAVIVPHAGYPYSGPVAASAYSLFPEETEIRRVVVLGPVHRVPIWGLALSGADGFETPLGVIPLDQEASADLEELPQVSVNPAAHALEHSIEVQLPFLQTVLGEFRLIPLVVGEVSPDLVAQVLERLWGGAETLIVVSSDLSHYHPYNEARTIDTRTARTILNSGPPLTPEEACGCMPVNGLLAVARKLGLRVTLLDLRNSGDTEGDKKRVVGYGAFAFFEDQNHGR